MEKKNRQAKGKVSATIGIKLKNLLYSIAEKQYRTPASLAAKYIKEGLLRDNKEENKNGL